MPRTLTFRKFWIRVALSLGALVVSAIAVEVGFGFTKPGQRVIFHYVPEVGMLRAPNQRGYDRGNEFDGQWVRMSINSLGMRGGEIPEVKNPNEKRILCIGDSFVFGGGLDDEDTFPAIAQKKCGLPAESLRWMNGGGVGHDGRESAAFLDLYHQKLKPDIVVFGWNWNDLVSILEGGSERYKDSLEIPALTSIADILHIQSITLRRLSTVKYISYKLNPYKWGPFANEQFQYYRTQVANCSMDGDADQRWKFATRTLIRMNETCKQLQARFFVYVMPELTWLDAEQFQGMPRLREALERLQIPWADAHPSFYEANKRGEHLTQRFDPTHPSKEGQTILAELLVTSLAKEGLLTIPPKTPEQK